MLLESTGHLLHREKGHFSINTNTSFLLVVFNFFFGCHCTCSMCIFLYEYYISIHSKDKVVLPGAGEGGLGSFHWEDERNSADRWW